MRKGGQADITKLIGAFKNFAKNVTLKSECKMLFGCGGLEGFVRNSQMQGKAVYF
jgi:hypothetical protein